MPIPDPRNIPGCQFWIDADQETGTTGSALATVHDWSGNARDFTGTGTAQPTTQTNVQNGRRIIRFDGSDDRVDFTGYDPDGNTGFTIFTVASYTTNNQQSIVGCGESASWGQINIAPRRDGFYHRFGTGEASNDRFTARADPGAVFEISAITRNGTAERQLRNGSATPAASFTVANATLANNSNAWAIGFDLRQNLFWTGDLAEIVVYAGVLTDRQIDSVGAYLAAKWALTWTASPSALRLSTDAADAGVTVGSGTKKKAYLDPPSGSSTQVVKVTAAGPTAPLQMTDGAGTTDGTAISWYSDPLAGVTIAGAASWAFWTQEDAALGNVGAAIKVERCDIAGNVLSTIIDPVTSQGAGEASTTAAADSGSITAANVTDTTLTGGDRLRITIWIDDAAGQGGSGSMGASHWGKAWYGAATGQGLASVTFAETLSEYSRLPSGTRVSQAVQRAATR